MNILGQHWKNSSGKVWISCFPGIFWAFLLAFYSAFSVGIKPSLALICIPDANHYSISGSAAAAPWNNGNSPLTWKTCPPNTTAYQGYFDWTSDGNGNCCAASSIGMTQGEFVIKNFQTSALILVAITIHGFFITLNIVVRRR